MPTFRGTCSCTCLLIIQIACSEEDATLFDSLRVHSTSAALRDLTASEAAADLEQLFGYIQAYYGPYEYKEARFGYSIAKLQDDARARLADDATEDGFYAAANWFLSRLQDGHLNLLPNLSSNPVSSYDIGLFLTPVEGKALVAEIDPSLADIGVAYGVDAAAACGAHNDGGSVRS